MTILYYSVEILQEVKINKVILNFSSIIFVMSNDILTKISSFFIIPDECYIKCI